MTARSPTAGGSLQDMAESLLKTLRDESEDKIPARTHALRSAPGEALAADKIEALTDVAADATDFLKTFAHEERLQILCHLVPGEKSVTELEQSLSSRQPAVSQQLARLRFVGMVVSRREGKSIYYSLADDRARRLIELVYEMFCVEDGAPPGA